MFFMPYFGHNLMHSLELKHPPRLLNTVPKDQETTTTIIITIITVIVIIIIIIGLSCHIASARMHTWNWRLKSLSFHTIVINFILVSLKVITVDQIDEIK